jgi:enoyl-[acyl-carrier protein] reductase I
MTTGKLLAGKRGLVMGVANDHSIAWGIAKQAAENGAELAFTYQGEGFGRRLAPLAESVGSDIVMPCDVEDTESMDAVFAELEKKWGRLDFLVHSIAYAGKEELHGRYIETSRDGFARALSISCFSLTEVTRRAAPLMTNGGSIVTMTYLGASRVMPNYNVMGVAKAALEASVRYLAIDLGGDGIRVNAISAGTMRTLAGAGIGDARYVHKFNRDNSPLKRNMELSEVGNAGMYLLSDLSNGVSGEVMHVDGGFHAVGIPKPENVSAE